MRVRFGEQTIAALAGEGRNRFGVYQTWLGDR
jgi:hypothetical protein